MPKNIFTQEEIELLQANPNVKAVSPTRIQYTEEFKENFIRESSSGKGATAIFRNAGFPTKLIGAKRIERAAARWRAEYGLKPEQTEASSAAAAQAAFDAFASANGKLSEEDDYVIKNKTVSKRELKAYIKQLPQPLQDHAERCKKLATYILERLGLADWYMALDLKEEDIINAIYYHDFGKAFIDKDCFHYEHCTSAAQKAEYVSHVEKSRKLIDDMLGLEENEILGSKCFAKMLIDAVSYHHAYDDEIYPSIKDSAVLNIADVKTRNGKRAVPFVGRLAAIVDCFDHLYYDADSGKDFNKAVSSFKKIAKSRFDTRLSRALTDNKKTLAAYLNYIDKDQHSKRKVEYGIHLQLVPVAAIRTVKKQNSALLVKTFINDPYYGDIDPETYRFAAEQTGQIIPFEKLAFQRLCSLMKLQADKGRRLPMMHFGLSVMHLKTKTGLGWIKTLLQKYSLPADNFCFIFREDELLGENVSIKLLTKDAAQLGLKVGLGNFASSQYSLLPSLVPDTIELVYFAPDTAANVQEDTVAKGVLSGEMDILSSLGISAVFTGIDSESAERSILSIGASYASGELYASPSSEKRLNRFCIDIENGK